MVWVTPIASLLALAASLSLSGAKELDVWNAPIIKPDKHTVWKVGANETVEWSTAGMPALTSGTFIYLVELEKDKEVILMHDELASGFDYHTGNVRVKVPWSVVPGEYKIVLGGDSENLSDTFKIKAA